ncbi:signal peptide peptidase SppA [Caldithrix abyssi]
MKTFFQVFLAVFLSLVIIIFGGLFLFSAAFDSSPDIPGHAFLEFQLSGDLPDYAAPDPMEEALGKTTLDMKKFRENLEKAAVDKRVHAVIIRPELFNGGFAQIQEMYALIKKFKAISDKKVYAFLGSDFSFTRDYYLACATDSIFMPADASLFLTGVRSEVTFYKDFFKKIGVEAQFLQIAEYKNAPEVYTRNTMSPYHRQVLNEVIDQYFNDVVQTISESRNIPAEKVEYLINRVSGFSGKEALEYGLVDDLAYYSDLKTLLKKRQKRIKKLSATTYSRVSISSLKIRNKSRVAVINCVGTIYSGSESDNPWLGKLLGAKTIIDNIQRAAKSKSIKAIILRIDSPGGSLLPSAAIWRAIMEAKKKKPVIATISDLGASGGYFIAMAADTIVANPNSLVGSIGIFAGKFNFTGTYDKLGLNVEAVQKGENADLFSIVSPWSKQELAIIQKIIKQSYRDFVQKVARARKMSFDEAEKLARGRVWTGEQAFSLGLIDTVGTFYTALKIAKQRAGIPEAESVRLVYYPKQKSFLNEILSNIETLAGLKEQNLLKGLQNAERIFTQWQNKPLALLPFRIEFK